GALSTGERLAEIPEILELHHVAGEDCFLAKVRVADAEALGRLLRERLSEIETITSTRTTVVLDTVKETSVPPIVFPEEVEEAQSAGGRKRTRPEAGEARRGIRGGLRPLGIDVSRDPVRRRDAPAVPHGGNAAPDSRAPSLRLEADARRAPTGSAQLADRLL